MSRKQALALYLVGVLGQISLVSIAVFMLRSNRVVLDYSTLPGLIAIAIGGISSALWGTVISIKYRNSNFKNVFFDFFRVTQNPINYIWMLIFLLIDFLPILIGGTITVSVWYLPILMFIKHIAFGGLEEIGWRYLFQPLLQERINYFFATIITFLVWGIWHFLFFYIDGTKAEVMPFLLGLLVNSFILSALYVKTKNLWICVMTHSLINVLSQIISGGNPYIVCFTRVAIIVLAVVLVTHTNTKIKGDNYGKKYSKLLD